MEVAFQYAAEKIIIMKNTIDYNKLYNMLEMICRDLKQVFWPLYS